MVKPIDVSDTARRYVPGLDGLRAIAVLFVLLYHTDPEGIFQGGFIGVDLFFVLSAFLITSILVDEQERTGTIKLRRFYGRRIVRLMPALLLFLAAYVAVFPMIVPDYPHWRDALIAGTYISNFAYVAEQVPNYIRHTWSLAAEEQFYLLWPAVLLLIMRAKKPVLLLGAVWLNLTVLRLTTDDWVTYYYGLLPHGSGLVLGAMLYFLVRRGRIILQPRHALAAGGILAILALNSQLGASALPIAVAEFASAIIIGAVITNPGSLNFLKAQPLVMIGKLSYGMYLWHYPVAFYLRGSGSFWSNFVIVLAVSTALAGLSYVTVERWAKRLREPGRPLSGNVAEATA